MYGVNSNLLKLLENYLNSRQILPWQNILAAVLQGSVFLIYINDLSDGIASTCKIFADDTSFFSILNDKNSCNTQLNSNFEIINGLCNGRFYLTKTNKQALKVCFSNRHDKRIIYHRYLTVQMFHQLLVRST